MASFPSSLVLASLHRLPQLQSDRTAPASVQQLKADPGPQFRYSLLQRYGVRQ